MKGKTLSIGYIGLDQLSIKTCGKVHLSENLFIAEYVMMKSSSKEGWVSMLSQEMQIAFKHITFTGQFVRCLHDFGKKFIG